MSERYVIVHRTYDPIQGELLGEILRENGLAARVLGTRNGALVGVGQNILQLHIEVPASQAGAATDFLEAYFETDGAELLREQGVLDDEPEEELAISGDGDVKVLRPLFAAGSVLLMFGGSHLYAQRYWAAAVLAAVQVYALSHLSGAEWPTVATGLVMFAAVLGVDLLGGQLAVRSFNRGERPSVPRELLAGTALAAVAVALASAVGPLVPRPKNEIDPYYAPEPPVIFERR